MRHPLQRLFPWLREAESDGDEDPLPDGWAEDLDIDTLDYLHSESRKRLLEQREEIEALKAKAPAIAGFATVIMIATGILGDLRISFSDDAVVSALFMVALCAFVCVLLGGGIVIWPRPMRTGVNPVWLGSYARVRANAARLLAATVEAQVDAFSRNRATYERDRKIINGMMVATTAETLAIVALIVVRAWPSLA